MDKKRVLAITIITMIIGTIIGGTLAYWSWQSPSNEDTNITLTVGSNFSCSANGGGNITNTNYFVPTDCTNSTYALKRTITTSITNNSNDDVYMDLWLNINSIGTGLSNSTNFKYALTTDSSSCTNNVAATGNFKGKVANDKVELLSGVTSGNTYYLYIWLDKEETDSSTYNQSVSLSLGGECSNEKPILEKPILTEGLIPVKIANNGTVTAISKNDATWFNYSDKLWANAVLTTSNNRSTYQAIANGTGSSMTIPDSEILAYYVWIPRYSYKIWTLDASQAHTGDEQTIDIKFVDTNTKENGTTIGSWYTHPAFTFGTQELSGFWVGKFEPTGTSSNPTILPNKAPLVSQDIGVQFFTSLKFAGGTQSGSNVTFAGNSTYGLTSTADSHMMKNSEWGAVAYLSHSTYGINDEIKINNYWNNILLTGCGTNTSDANSSTTCDITYGSASSYPQSTTGNISGVFDMSGGAVELVMGVYNDSNGGYFSAMPSNKYCDSYSSDVFVGNSNTNMTFCTLATCGGHALSETTGWYGDLNSFLSSEHQCFGRGSTAFTSGVNAGVWFVSCYDCSGGNLTSWRSVLVTR